MRARSSIAAALVLTLTMMHAPVVAHAEEAQPAPEWLVRAPAPIDLNVHGLGRAWPGHGGGLHSAFSPAPVPIRLSKGATTAIIVGAIVVGVLLIAGVVVLAKKPGKL